MFLAKISIDRPVMVTMAILVFVVFGAMAYMEMPLNLMPDVELPYVSIMTVYSGAGPREVETQVTAKLEEVAATVPQIDYIQSYSIENVSIILVAFEQGKDINVGNSEVKDKVDGVLNDLPDGVDRPSVQKFDFSAFPFMDLVLSGDMDSRELYELADGQLKERLSQIEGVAQVSINGGAKREIGIEVPNRVVFQNSISPTLLNQILAAHNMDMPAGTFISGNQQYSVRLKGEFSSVQDIANLDIPTMSGPKKLGSLANVIDGQEKVTQKATYFNVKNQVADNNIIRLSITKSSDGNVVNIAEQVRKELPALQSELPPNTLLNVIRDDSEFTRSTVADTLNTIWMGILLTGLILLLFLHDLRSTIIVALSMPISIISTFIFLQAAGFTLNMLTLTGFSTAVGILVTNSVVVIENIFRHKEMGNGRKEASFKGTAEITIAVLASTLTNIVVFLPMASMKSMVGGFLKEFALTVTFATIFSLISSFTITPMLASIIIPDKAKTNKFGLRFDRIFDRFSDYYLRFMRFVLRNKGTSIGILVVSVLMLFASFLLVPGLGFELMPAMDQGNVTVSVELPEGVSLDETAKVVEEVNQRVSKHNEVEHVVSNIGSQGFINTASNVASTDVKLVDADDRSLTTLDMVGVITKDLADIPNAIIKVSDQSNVGMGGSGISFFIQGQDQDVLEQLKIDVMDQIRDIPGLLNVDSSSRPGTTELTLYPKREKLAEIGATVYDLAIALRTSIEGMVNTYYRESGNQYDIRLTMPDEDVNHPDKIMNMSMVVNGQSYLLSQLVDISFAAGVYQLIHVDRYKSIEITGNAAKGFSTGQLNGEITKRLNNLQLPNGYRIRWGQEAEMLNETMVDMIRTFLIAVLLTYMLLAAILESFTQPLIILATIPLAIIGVILALFFSGVGINIFSMLAIIMLVGIVVNNAILILDYVNVKRKEGMCSHDALLEAGKMKLKPIIMSTLSIVIGMLPMALGVGSAGKEFRMSMGIVSIGGLVVSTLLTLIVIPAFYYLSTHNEVNKEICNEQNR
ncbi:MAG: efflux RND transporter permease subunit [Candidatus Cloacimonetes bacterium]|jgi:HAE1 family hydrophobic/amphiphilic exporter-1|nr:efflux RND transporter permease subunit [Candidatus Cloacimonadota bacterium]MCK9332028.1 efflux RND transporter permease subunit [Candidatus Cloacimonadota bacterium]MDD2211035.1 efflux RND transporter permease subunit [Candidatus Cloacimonadota bacterium]MDD4687647.1 efflux RND transporter permease subunit [Candidatus Cloacimonadota bacterium]MDY0299605.1 efflux RND transporter permease subunit [Candidatus Cloacimonadaceae bacterium]